MSAWRCVLSRVALVGLLAQVLGTTVPPALLWATTTTDADCTCMTGNHAMCPMHHRSRTGCSMRATADDGTAMLAPLTVVAVLRAQAPATIARRVATRTGRLDVRRTARRPIPPDPPPPRA